MSETLYDKIWNSHVIVERNNEPSLIYIDRHLLHEVTSPQAFDGLKLNQRYVRRPDLTIATVDHNVPTINRSSLHIIDNTSYNQIKTLENNCKYFGIKLFGIDSPDQGIVHVIGPQLGVTIPGTTIVCGDSHTSTHGAFGALSFGIGTSDIEHVLSTQTIWMEKLKSFEVKITGKRKNKFAITAKDIILSIIRMIGTSGGNGTVIEYTGNVISELSIEQRMTICNMSIEAGAQAGIIAPDEKTFNYLNDRKYTPKNYDHLVSHWKKHLHSDLNAKFDKIFIMCVDNIAPQVSWGTSLNMVSDITEKIPTPEEFADGDIYKQKNAEDALAYMDLKPETPMNEISIDRVFIGSCTNSRLEDLIDASKVIYGKKISNKVKAIVVPGSQKIKKQAEELGLDKIFKNANFEWRESGCSMCIGMNPDFLLPGERCASTSNRNFEGRQGTGGRTHLVSPVMAAAAALEGHFVDVRELDIY